MHKLRPGDADVYDGLALEGVTETLAAELDPEWNIKVCTALLETRSKTHLHGADLYH